MFFNHNLLSLAALLAPATSAMPLSSSSSSSSKGLHHHNRLPLPYTIIDQLSQNGTFLENVETRRNGDLVITQNEPVAKLWLVREPWKLQDAHLSLVHTFDNADGLLGLAEVGGPDHFAVVTTKWGANVTPIANSSTVREFQLNPDGTLASQGYVGRYPDFGVLNGVVALPPPPGGHGCSSSSSSEMMILAADSVDGVIRKINTRTGSDEGVVIDVPEMKASDPDATLSLAVNGLKIHGSYLYWTNSNTVGIYRVAVDMTTGHATGEVETMATFAGEFLALDDFDVDAFGNVWVVTNLDNTLMVVKPDGTWETVLGSEGDLAVAGATSARFGRTEHDSHILYVPTSGGMNFPVNGTVVEPAKLVAVDTRGYYYL